ncbi:MAG TPA: type III pantothenate kinase [Sphingobacteriaceae bacterium]|nr:type III pantothenate kinase [Sphingobacteriaceae bacterium]
MSNLVIDMGNSRTKIAVFRDRQLIYHEAVQLTEKRIYELIKEFHITTSILSSVTKNEEFLKLLERDTTLIQFSHRYPASVKINYKTPETLGLDRLAGVIGAMQFYKNKNVLVIDCGTCITMDAITGGGQYSGGSISPGLNMRLKALHTFTDRLPLVNLNNDFTGWQGADTVNSILSGVLEGAFQEVLGFINKYVAAYPGLQVLLCGGDANFFDTRLKNSIFAPIVETEPALVLIGLNEVIHHYND